MFSFPKRRYFEEYFVKALMLLSTGTIVLSFFLILGAIFMKGFPALRWSMISSVPKGGFYIGGEGGILNAIIGSLYIAGGASVLGLLISIPIVLYMNVYLPKHSWLSKLARLGYDVMFGIPSIVYGAFGFGLMVFLGMKASLLGGIIVITLLVIPIMIRTMDEVAGTVPKELKEAAYALGATRLEAAGVVLRQVSTGILTAALLAFGRAIGDAAAVLFTAGFSDNIPTRLTAPAATLPLAIFFQLSSPIEKVQNRAYAAAALLTLIVLGVSFSARLLGKRFSEHKI